jgi:hypothetical protein
MSCIVVFRHPDRIILACDSLATSATEDATALGRFTAEGKIGTYGPWALTTAGFSRGPNGLDVRQAIGREIAGVSTMAEALTAVQRVFVRRLLPNLALARHYPMFRELFDASNGALLAAFIAGRDPDGTLILGSFGANLVNPDTFEVQMHGGTCPGVMADGRQPFYFCVGQDPTASLVSNGPRPDWLRKADRDAAVRLLQMQTDATPDLVQPPFHVVEITRDGIERTTA